MKTPQLANKVEEHCCEIIMSRGGTEKGEGAMGRKENADSTGETNKLNE